MSVNKVNSDGSTTLISGATLWADSPIGTILAYGGATAPAGWFICDGTELTKTDYAELYAVIGDSFGTASVNTKFVLPDLREATTKGVGENPNGEAHVKSGGLALGEYIDDRLQDHTHIGTYNDYPNGVYYATSGNQFKAQTGSISSEARKGATTEVKAVGVNYIIKAKQVALPADLESAVEEIATRFPDYSQNLFTSNTTSWTAPEDCYGIFTYVGGGSSHLHIDGEQVSSSDQGSFSGGITIGVTTFSGYIKKGSVVTKAGASDITTEIFKAFALL